MAKLDGLQTVLDFLQGLQPKIAAQIAKKVLGLNVDPLPNDSKQLILLPLSSICCLTLTFTLKSSQTLLSQTSLYHRN
jgi:hypothetical protein